MKKLASFLLGLIFCPIAAVGLFFLGLISGFSPFVIKLIYGLGIGTIFEQIIVISITILFPFLLPFPIAILLLRKWRIHPFSDKYLLIGMGTGFVLLSAFMLFGVWSLRDLR